MCKRTFKPYCKSENEGSFFFENEFRGSLYNQMSPATICEVQTAIAQIARIMVESQIIPPFMVTDQIDKLQFVEDGFV